MRIIAPVAVHFELESKHFPLVTAVNYFDVTGILLNIVTYTGGGGGNVTVCTTAATRSAQRGFGRSGRA
jgi:hypothetical protein